MAGHLQGSAPMGVAYTGKQDNRLLSPGIWKDCPIEGILAGRADGLFLFDDFGAMNLVAAGAQAAYGIYKGFASTGGTGADGAAYGGQLVLSSDGDNEGASIADAITAFQISASKKKFWFEARIKSSTITDAKHGILIGMMDKQTLTVNLPLDASSDPCPIADVNFVGFWRDEGDGDKFDTYYKANGVTAVAVAADAVTLVADTFVKLGMVFDPDNANKLTFYADGVALADTKTIPNDTGTDFPADIALGRVAAVINETAATPGNTTLDWWAVAQLG